MPEVDDKPQEILEARLYKLMITSGFSYGTTHYYPNDILEIDRSSPRDLEILGYALDHAELITEEHSERDYDIVKTADSVYKRYTGKYNKTGWGKEA